jgi:hypothetical protein
MIKRLLFAIFLATTLSLNAQEISPIPYFTYGKGLGIISPDSLFMLNIRFRIQNRVGITTVSASDWDVKEVEARVRRLRLRFDGFIYTKKLNYVIQLAFSRGDLDYDDTGFPNIIRDAMVIYNFNPHFGLGLGQTKLPGNRQRITSSGDLQFPDRSIVNATFNIDRDFGAQVYYNNTINRLFYVLRGAVSTGEGRNFNTTDHGLAYTGRLELLPFGTFTNGGDYFEGDLAREPKPKVSLGLTYSYNSNTKRTGGQLGKFLYEPRDMDTRMADFLLKYNGWALAVEYLRRTSPDPITENTEGEVAYIYSGHGMNFQGSYLIKNNYEIATRFSEVRPDEVIQSYTPQRRDYTIGATKYLRGHRVKFQFDWTYQESDWLGAETTELDSDAWQIRFQIEAGI